MSDGGCYGSAQLAALCGNEGGSAQSAVAATVNRAVCSTHQSLLVQWAVLLNLIHTQQIYSLKLVECLNKTRGDL